MRVSISITSPKNILVGAALYISSSKSLVAAACYLDLYTSMTSRSLREADLLVAADSVTFSWEHLLSRMSRSRNFASQKKRG
jgi:hypothetical protein